MFIIARLTQNRRELLVPWILVMCLDIGVEFVHFVYLLIKETVTVLAKCNRNRNNVLLSPIYSCNLTL